LKKATFLLLAVTLICLSSASLAFAYDTYKKQAIKMADGTTISGGVIRIDPVKKVYIHTNSTHHSRGIQSVGIDTRTGAVKIVRDQSDAVITISADEDESLAARNIKIGISGGGLTTLVFFYQNGRKLNMANKNDFNKVASTTSNFWIQWISEPF